MKTDNETKILSTQNKMMKTVAPHIRNKEVRKSLYTQIDVIRFDVLSYKDVSAETD